MGSSFVDEIDCGNFFDQIDDLIEFPPENECAGGGDLVISSGEIPSMWNNALPESDILFSGGLNNAASDFSTELSVPYEDIVQLEWLSTFVEDSFSGGGMTMGKENLCMNKEVSQNQFKTSSPVSVLESSSSSSSEGNHRGPQRARSKRPRPASFNPRAPIQLTSPGLSENFVEMKKMPRLGGAGQKKKLLDDDPIQSVRKCMHCEITKTPQWRAGPMGPKTLCNACGVRHKSGRLFPEYRPAASPTFVPSLHSNSHKKVVEMRSKVGPAKSEIHE